MDGRDPLTEAFWLPGLDARDHDGFETRAFGEWRALVPRLRPHGVRRLARELVDRRDRVLARRPVRALVEQAAAAAARCTTPGDPLRAALERALPAATGYAPAMIADALDRLRQDWSAAAWWDALRAEFGEPEMLDAARPRPHRPGRVRAVGPRLVAHVFAGNVPGVAVTSLVRALLVKAASFGKTASGEPLTAVAFARALADVDPELGACLAVTYWPGGDTAREAALFEVADTVIAYGTDATIADLRARVPWRTTFRAYPHRIGVALVGREALQGDGARTLAERAALDVATFDQQGCVAPHSIYVEGDADAAAEFAAALGQALETLERRWPRRRLDAAEAAAIHEARARVEIRGGRVWAPPRGTAWTVALDPDPAFAASPLNRTVFVKPVPDLESALRALEPVRPWLQSVGLAATDARRDALGDALAELGATRIAPLGACAWPDPRGHADGRFQFLDLVRFADIDGPDFRAARRRSTFRRAPPRRGGDPRLV